MNSGLVLCLCVFSILFALCRATTCNSLNHVEVQLHQQNGNTFNKTITGCIERIAFDSKTIITKAFIREQDVPILGRDTIRNMAKLTTATFLECNLVHVESGALRNVPRLKSFQISNGNLKEISREIFIAAPKLELLRINNNQIDLIADYAFSNLPSLKKIYVNNNELEHWNKEWFVNTTSLEIMNFQFNKIRTLPKMAFNFLRNLTQIYFDYNEIFTIQADAFKGLRNITHLGLRYNRLTAISENIFPNTIKIKSLVIDANYLNFLPNEVLNRIAVKELTIQGNPWKCPCLDRINGWVFKKKGVIKKSEMCTGDSIPDCAASKVFSTTCIETVDTELTKLFIQSLRNLSVPLGKYCARTDQTLIAI